MGILGYLGLAIIVVAIIRFLAVCVRAWKEKHNGN